MVTIFDSESLKQGGPGEKLIFEYQGEVSIEIIPYILENLEAKVREFSFEKSKARRLGKICLEALQNMHVYYEHYLEETSPKGAYMFVYSTGEGFLVLMANYIRSEHKLNLFKELKELNEIAPRERKKLYLVYLEGNSWTKEGGAGLGLIEMLWKSENRFKYEFEDVDPNYSMFILRLKVGQAGSSELEIQASAQSPYLNFSPFDGQLLIKGRSIPENAVVFYSPLFEALNDYLHEPNERTEVNICLDYINTSSSKCLLEVFKLLEQIQDNGKEVFINWCYEEGDDDMLEAGEDYELIVKLPFGFTALEEI